ncbi:hypothetical protein BH10PSE1_BH10PSE1_27550 [soil metagenome]
MADGALNLTLSDYTSAKLTEKATAMGVTPEKLAAMLLDGHLFDYDDFTWTHGDPREAAPPHQDLNEEGRPWSEVRPEFITLIEKTFGPSE